MMFKIRTSPVLEGTQPYAWDVASIYQCTWYCYYRALECGLSAPTWWDRETKAGSYPNAKDWLENFREPWEVKEPSYKPVAGDILVYDGEFGHVIFMETDVMTSEYRSGDKDSFRNAKLGDYKGELLGVLHCTYSPVSTVERNENVVQIQTTDEQLRIRTAPSLDAEIVGHVQLGYYNVLNEKDADGYTWYEIEKDRWCANITTNYLPASGDDIIKEIQKYFDQLKDKAKVLSDENTKLKGKLDEIKKIAEY